MMTVVLLEVIHLQQVQEVTELLHQLTHQVSTNHLATILLQVLQADTVLLQLIHQANSNNSLKWFQSMMMEMVWLIAMPQLTQECHNNHHLVMSNLE